MRKLFLIICMIVFANCANNILAGNGDKAWISERFALQIIHKKNLQSKYIFPIVGFETHNGCLYILTYGGEMQPVATKTTKDGMLLSNFQYTINLSSWPKCQIEKYSKSKVYYQYVGDKIEVEIKTGKYTEHLSFTSNVYGSRFRNLLEFKGWLLDFLLPTIKR
ncbi:MAG: hypothetical protein IJ582_03630 [Prevotella sp.]|nr:hypothetical protein [Prevotella sp.]